MFCKYCGKEIENGAESCPYCGKSFVATKNTEPEKGEKTEEFRQSVGPEDGTNSAAAAGTQPPRTGGLSRQWIIAIVVIVIAVVVIVSVVVFVNNRSGSAGNSNGITSEVKPKLSADTIAAANDALQVTDDYITGKIYIPRNAESSINDAKNSIVLPDSDDATYSITLQVRNYIEAIVDEISKDEIVNKATGVAGRLSGTTGRIGADKETLKEYYNQLAQYVKENS